MDGFKKVKRDLKRSEFRVFEFGPGVFVVSLDGGHVFGERQLAADIGVQMAVGDMVDDLLYRPSAFAVRGIKLLFVQTGDRHPKPPRQPGDFFDVFGAELRCGIGVGSKGPNGIAKVSHKRTPLAMMWDDRNQYR